MPLRNLIPAGESAAAVLCMDRRHNASMTGVLDTLNSPYVLRLPGGAGASRRRSGRQEVLHGLRLAQANGVKYVVLFYHDDCADCADHVKSFSACLGDRERASLLRSDTWRLERLIQRRLGLTVFTVYTDPHLREQPEPPPYRPTPRDLFREALRYPTIFLPRLRASAP